MVGLLCHPKKLKPLCQVQEYTGFLFDSRGIPCLRVPSLKHEKAGAMVNYLLSKLDHFEFSVVLAEFLRIWLLPGIGIEAAILRRFTGIAGEMRLILVLIHSY